ncbi:MAG TPA: tetraacyldisaccharide 4'-kinase [Spongiibacteraceae bacterium]|nr:tetraacyldisaccharide 4'-kinase [Spongiibacteraceae bacterium]
MNLEASLQRRWYGRPGWLKLLLPLEGLYRLVVALRRRAYRQAWLPVWRAPVPIVVVGNIAVGGTGKTPVVIALCNALRRAGFTPGIISRGYGASPAEFPYSVTTTSTATESGDEPLLLARRSGCPVVIAPRRVAAAQYLLARHDLFGQHQCDVIICDDGLQHYALARAIELVVVDAARGFGNGHCLPVGPLRESLQRLRSVDALLWNGAVDTESGAASAHDEIACPQYAFHLAPTAVVHLASGRELPVADWAAKHPRVHAVAGIGNPARFFATVRQLGCQPVEHAFADHQVFAASDFNFAEQLPVLMTEKDAVKCAALAMDNFWFLRVEAALPDSLLTAITGKLGAR